ncbi:MAG: glycosyltransferase family 2 protein [Candidatus Gastranaerophilaceae bacterium]
MKLIIQIPCFNEEETLPETLKFLPKQIDGIDEIETMVIDDGSSDRTADIASWNGVNHIIKLNRHQGLAVAFKTGLNEAIKKGADIIVNTDADNQYCADDIELLVKPILEKSADIVIGARPINSINNFSPLKKLLQKLGSTVIRIISKSDIQDAPSGFRAFSKDAASVINIFDKYTYTMETIIQANPKGLIIKSIPVRVNVTTRKSRLVKNIFDYVKNSMFTMLRIFIIYRPFRFFALIASIILFLGFILGARFLYFYLTGSGAGHIQSLILTSILIMTGVQVGLIAVLADLLAINRKLIEDVQLRVKKLEK